MRISVFGMGYVGSVTAACLARDGHDVVGVDVNEEKIRMIASGTSPIIEPALAEIVSESVRAGRLRGTTRAQEAMAESDISLVCVGTPSMRSGRLDLNGVEHVSRELGSGLKDKRTHHTIAIRSTVLPGTVETLVVPALESHSGRKSGADFAVCYNPEFMREGTAVKDYYAPPFTVIGANRAEDADAVAEVYKPLGKPIVRTEIRVAEMLKYSCNAFHALKIAFANEVGTLAHAVGVPSDLLMEIFCSDDKLNISKTYLKPGFAFGGSCLPKDIRAMLYRAKELDLDLPLLEAILPSNQLHIARGVDLVMGTGKRKIAVLGLSFKANTDDLRESPMIELVKTLLGEGRSVKIYDEKVELSSLFGANRKFIEQTIPHIAELLNSSLERVVSDSEVVVLGRDAHEFAGLSNLLREDHVVIELARLSDEFALSGKRLTLC